MRRVRNWATLMFLTVTLLAIPVAAQDGDDPGEPVEEDGTQTSDDAEDGGAATWRPSPATGASRRPPMMTGGEDTTFERPTQLTHEADNDDGRAEILVFDIEYDPSVSFEDTYLERFDATFWGTLESSPEYRALTTTERNRRLRQAAQLVIAHVTDERAAEIAEAIGAAYYMVPRVDAADSRNYRITLSFGPAGTQPDQTQVFEVTSNRSIDNVDDGFEEVAEQALSTAQ